MISFFQFFTQKLRLSNPWRYKVPLLISFCYFLILVGNVYSVDAYLSFFAAIATTIGFMGFGYFTNDLADRKKDALAGKSNGTAQLSGAAVSFLALTFLAIAILPWLYLPLDRISIICIVVELMLFVLYAFPPFRFKEKGILGVITDALYAHVVPGFLASWTFFLVGNQSYENFWMYAITLLSWQFFSGVRNIVSHHYKDFENDHASSTRTFATQIGKERIYRLMKGLLIPLEVVSALVFLYVVQLEIDVLYIAFIGFMVLALWDFKNGEAETRVKHFTNTFLDRFYIHWFPYIVLFTLAFRLNDFWLMLVTHLIFFHPILGGLIRRFTVKREESKEEHSVSRTALISPNRSQYSETFIRAHIELVSQVVVYADGYFPTSISVDRGESWCDLPKTDDPESALIESWKANNVQVVLAEYGLSGVEVMNACKTANLPLVVHFHGFDAYRDDVLRDYGDRYLELFEYASKIIVVSKAMRDQLLYLKCPSEKIEWLPYGVDTELFSPPESQVERHHFVACGRFVPKKSPLSTIRAFAKVVEIHPNVLLTFIGDGELLHEAIALSKELNLDGNVIFKGVLTSQEVAYEFRKHSIFVQHSVVSAQNDSEGTPLSILEAAASELAIVATRHGGISDVIESGKNGFLVEEGDIEGMAQRMLQLLENHEIRTQFGTEARITVLQNYRQSDYIDSLECQLSQAETPIKNEPKFSIWKKRFMAFLVVFLLVEISLRIFGFKPGVIEDFYFHRGEVHYDSLLYADELGITHIMEDAQLIVSGEINSEGFFSSVEFTPESMNAIRKTGRKIVMLIGDSYTQGCCADDFSATFAQIINQSDRYEVLNFGVPGADPVQYRLIVEKYAPILKPDLILVAVYGGNDILEYDRTAKPFVPLSYPIKNGPWLNSEGPIYLTKQGTFFKNFNEAKAHYFDYFSLWSDESNFFEKTIRYSVLLSRPYLKWKTKRRFEEIKYQMPKKMNEMPYSNQNLRLLSSVSADLKIPVQFTLIPSPSDVSEKRDLIKKYNFVFEDLDHCAYTNDLKVEDYDGLADANHFNNQGHRKYAKFLLRIIDKRLSD
jgi:colanic acid/amylovoran biosynthesis glycosyltransferase